MPFDRITTFAPPSYRHHFCKKVRGSRHEWLSRTFVQKESHRRRFFEELDGRCPFTHTVHSSLRDRNTTQLRRYFRHCVPLRHRVVGRETESLSRAPPSVAVTSSKTSLRRRSAKLRPLHRVYRRRAAASPGKRT